MQIAIRCRCGANLKVAQQLAGKRVRCPKCGAVRPIPAQPEASSPAPVRKREAVLVASGRASIPTPTDDPPPRPAEARRATPVARPAVTPASPKPLPGLALALTIVGFLDAAIVGVAALLIAVLGSLAVAGSDMMTDAERGIKEGVGDSVVEGIRAEGGRVLEDKTVAQENGTQVRRIVYQNADGSRGSMEIPMDTVTEKPAKQAKDAGSALLWIGTLLIAFVCGKILSGIGFLTRHNWGRLGTILFAAGQAALLGLFALKSGLGVAILVSLILNAGTAAYFLSPRVKAAMR